MTDSLRSSAALPKTDALRERAAKVIPGGIFGHMTFDQRLGMPDHPQFYTAGEGAYLWDVDGNKYIDFMCSFGPMLQGHRNPVVEAAAQAQAAKGDTLSAPSPFMVEFAELLTDTIAIADWVRFSKNGTDATSMAVQISRAATGKKKLLKAKVAYHGGNAWFTPNLTGITPEDRANIVEFDFNDVASLEATVAEYSGDIAAIILPPFKHDVFVPQVPIETAFALKARELATKEGATLILDEVRSGFRLDVHGAWESIGVKPDLIAYSKALANGYPIAATVGVESLRQAASEIYATGSFWYSAVPMAAGIANVTEAVRIDAPAVIGAAGLRFKTGLEKQAADAGLPLDLTGPTQMPLMIFADDPEQKKGYAFTSAAVKRGVLLHPWHNMFVSTAHTDDVVDEALAATAAAFDDIASLGL